MRAFERMQEEVRASHIMIALDGDALPADTLQVYNQLMDLRATILKGKLTFENAARTQSADTWSAKQGGDLGFLQPSVWYIPLNQPLTISRKEKSVCRFAHNMVII